jgi:hypothetical protein
MKMKHLSFAMALSVAAACQTQAQTTAFTYQGRLNDGANPANGSYDLTFALYDAPGGPTQWGSTITNTAVLVSNGLFTVTLDFGNQFPGANWLAIGVRANGGGAFATLSPRQALTATPYAIYAPNAGSAGSVGASNIVGNILPAQLPANVALRTGGNSFTGTQTITNGNVGIGTVTPATRLTVVTPDNSYGIEHTDGNRRLSTYLGNGAWFGTVSQDPFYLFVNDGGPSLTIGTNSNVGIGTALPGASTLQINNPFHAPFSSGLQVNHSINGVDIQINRGPGQGGTGLLVDNSGAGDASTSLLMLRNNVGVSPQTVLNVTADGNVQGLQFQGSGSGLSGLNASQLTAGTVADTRLSANVALRSGSNTFFGNQTIIGILKLTNTFSGYGDFRLFSYNGNGNSGTAFIQARDDSGTSSIDLVVRSQLSGVLQDAIRISSNGNVGIGTTTNPTVKLDVAGSVRGATFTGDGSGLTSLAAPAITSGTIADARLSANVALRSTANTFIGNQTVNGALTVTNTHSAFGDLRLYAFQGNGNNGTAFIQARDSSGTSSIDLALRSQLNGGFVDAMRISSNGNVGIGVTNTPDATLHVFSKPNVQPLIVVNNTTGLKSFEILTTDQANFNGDVYVAGKVQVASEITATAINLTSDRNAKEQFKPVKPREVLDKVAHLPISEWQYKSGIDKDERPARHIGPMAQDFREAFSLGRDDKHITSVDADGVALAAIQGLNEKLEEKLAEKTREVEVLKQSLGELRELVNHLTSSDRPATR